MHHNHPTNAQRCFLLSRANQLSFIIEGDTFFDEKPSLQTLVDDPDALRRHVQSCFRQDKSQLQLAVTYNASNMWYSSDAKKVRGSLPLPRCVRLPSLRAPSQCLQRPVHNAVEVFRARRTRCCVRRSLRA